MVAEIISVGTELLLGSIVNSDAQIISRGLSELGIDIYYHSVVGDNASRLTAALTRAAERADVIITTGGLGPTYDDITRETVSSAFALPLILHEPSWARIQAYFRRMGREITLNNKKQAMLPQGAVIFDNDWGTAPGCAFSKQGKHVLMLPGPPSECLCMWRTCASPYLASLSEHKLVSRAVRIFGLGESAVEDKIRPTTEHMTNPTVAPYAKEGEVLLRVTAAAQSSDAARALTEPVVAKLCELLGDAVYGVDVESLESVVADMLTERGLFMAVAESCTGGMIAKTMTDRPGATAFFRGGVCAYQNDVKTALLDVPPELIERYGAVSAETAAAMARGVKERFSADIAVSVTGFAGSSEPDRDTGLVYFGLSCGGDTVTRRAEFGAGRDRIRIAASLYAINMIRIYLLENKQLCRNLM